MRLSGETTAIQLKCEMHINKEAKETTSCTNSTTETKNLIDFSKTGEMLELFGIDFLFRHDKKSAGISYQAQSCGMR